MAYTWRQAQAKTDISDEQLEPVVSTPTGSVVIAQNSVVTVMGEHDNKYKILTPGGNVAWLDMELLWILE
ncbi:MAG: hypothetical protein HC892_00140 [Saprospiraceae bacterium]|nr:hypothetical protein [Saprospiraceae bacterium]